MSDNKFPQEWSPLREAIGIAGSYKKLADYLGLTKAAVYQWTLPSRKVPVKHCVRIQKMTGGRIRCRDLRPDVDWDGISVDYRSA